LVRWARGLEIVGGAVLIVAFGARAPQVSSNPPVSSPPPSSSPSAPTSSSTISSQTVAAAITSLVINPAGEVACIAGGRAAAYGTAWRTLSTPVAASSLAWRGNDWFLALPATGLVVNASGVPQNQSFTSPPVVVTARVTFLQNGEVADLIGRVIGRVPRVPSATLDLNDTTFALVDRTVYAIGDGVARRQTVDSAGSSLLETPAGIEVVPGIAARDDGFTYTASNTELTATNSARNVTGRYTLGSRVTRIAANGSRVAFATGARLFVLGAGDLRPIFEGSCGGGA
jgi:hypothetical protein